MQVNKLFNTHPIPWMYKRSLNDGACIVDAKGRQIIKSENDELLKLLSAAPRMLAICDEVTNIRSLTIIGLEDLAHDANNAAERARGLQ